METRKQSLEVCLAIGGGCLSLFYFWRLEGLLIAALCFVAIGLLWPTLAKLIAKWWLSLAAVLGRINSFLLLSLLYFFMLTPLALLRKVIKKFRKRGNDEPVASSYFIEQDHTYTAKDLKHPW